MSARRRTPKTHTQKRAPRRYTVDEQIKAVTAALAVGKDHALGEAGLEAAKLVLNAPVSKSALHRWLTTYQAQITGIQPALATKTDVATLIDEARRDVRQKFEEARDTALERAYREEVISKASYRDLMTGVGISQDKIANLEDTPAEIRILQHEFAELSAAANIPLADAYKTIIHMIRQANSQRLIDTLAHRPGDPPEK